MAGHRATSSVYATLGVAAATLLVVGGILAGPSILECSRDTGGFGACLREKVAESGLIAPDAEDIKQPDVVADFSSEPSAPPAPGGWMEANANEYEPPPSMPVDLAGSPADLTAAELSPAAEVPVEIVVAPAAALATAALTPSAEPVSVELPGPEIGLIAEGGSSAGPSEPPTVALVGPEGQIVAASPTLSPPIEGAAALVQSGGLRAEEATDDNLAVTSVTPEPIEAPGTITVADPAPVEPAPVELRAEVGVEPEPVEPAPVEVVTEVSVEPEPVAPPVTLEFNPEYPNVLVLPPPATGDNSSFRSLQLN